jgi:hypothetical protein
MLYETTELIELVLRRPRMFCDAQTLRELLLFIQGICTGREPPHGGCPSGFDEYVPARFDRPSGASWSAVLQREFGDRPFIEACQAIADLVHEWRATAGIGVGPPGA